MTTSFRTVRYLEVIDCSHLNLHVHISHQLTTPPETDYFLWFLDLHPCRQFTSLDWLLYTVFSSKNCLDSFDGAQDWWGGWPGCGMCRTELLLSPYVTLYFTYGPGPRSALVPVQFGCACCWAPVDKSACKMNEMFNLGRDWGAYSAWLVDTLSVPSWQLCDMCFVALLCVPSPEKCSHMFILMRQIFVFLDMMFKLWAFLL